MYYIYTHKFTVAIAIAVSCAVLYCVVPTLIRTPLCNAIRLAGV